MVENPGNGKKGWWKWYGSFVVIYYSFESFPISNLIFWCGSPQKRPQNLFLFLLLFLKLIYFYFSVKLMTRNFPSSL